jgi:hypothetical protein
MSALIAEDTIKSERRIKRKDGSWIDVELNGKQRPDERSFILYGTPVAGNRLKNT